MGDSLKVPWLIALPPAVYIHSRSCSSLFPLVLNVVYMQHSCSVSCPAWQKYSHEQRTDHRLLQMPAAKPAFIAKAVQELSRHEIYPFAIGMVSAFGIMSLTRGNDAGREASKKVNPGFAK